MRLSLLTILSMVMVNVFAQNPQITVSRNSITTSVANGGTTTQTFTITNTGNRDLTWKLKTKGVPVDFTKPAYANWTEASKQDRITSNVWLTRQNNQGLFNIATQSAFNSSAPAGTQWAFGESEDLQAGDYENWQSAVNGDPQSMIDNVISMHAIAEDRYFDITFHSFSGNNTGGGFSYTRVEHNLKWAAADFISGTLIPGQSKIVTLTFDASEITGGTYSGFAVVESNDPANAEKSVALNLNVATGSGAGEIDALTTKDLGEGYANFASEKILTINNIGTGILQITNVVSSNAAFVPEAFTFSIAPGQGYDLRVMFMPSTVGFFTGNITLTTNDSDEGTFVIAVSADGLGAPVSAVSATSVTTTLAHGSTSTLPFTLTNNGVSDLAYQFSLNLGKSAPVSFTKTNFADPLLPENQDRLSANVLITRAYQQGLFNAALETGFTSSTSPVNTQWSSSSTATSTPSSYTNWRNAWGGDPGDMIGQIGSVNLTLEDRYFDVELKQWTCCQNGGSFTYERTEIYNWVKASVTNGTLAQGANTSFDLQFNTAGLPAGTYTGTFIIKSNDPAAPVRNIPVSLTVTGTPEARTHETAVAFDNTAIGLISRKKIRVINDGAAPLNVTSVSYDDSEFTTYEATGTVQPLSYGIIEIAFTPSAVESYSGVITLTTNDPANPTLTIPYTAAGVSPGEINVVATDMNDAVTTGETVTKTITIENSGAGDLHWTAEMLNNNPVVSFGKEDYADFKDAANQDRIAPGVWITRKDQRGLFNIAAEEGYESNESPVGTEWQNSATFTADLGNYTDWEDAIDSDPLEAINQTYSVHAANEYYDLIVRSWTSNANGGGFSYQRQKAAGWIKLSQYSGTILPGESAEITVTYDPSNYVTSSKIETLVIKSDDPAKSAIHVPIQLDITGLSEIVASATELNFNNVGLGFNKSLSVNLTNTGTHALTISSITSSNPAFTVSHSTASLQVNESIVLNIQFVPGAVQSYTGELLITSNASNESGLTIDLSGVGIQVPDINVTPGSIIHRTTSQSVFNGTIEIQNNGGATLNWASGRASGYPLTDILGNLNSGFESITALIPSKYSFAYDGGAVNNINDGGSDMYDNGNYLNTNFANSILYSNNVVTSGDGLFGTGTHYFTRHLDGLFVMAADLKDVTNFSISGNNGADGSGSANAAVLSTTLNGTQYTGFLKRVYGASDPSINQLIIIENDAAVAHAFSTNSDETYQELSNLGNVKRVYYLLYAGASGGFIDDATAKSIMDKFIEVVSGGSGFLADWITLDAYVGSVAPGATQTINYTLDLTSQPDANYTSRIPISSNDPDESLVIIPVEINIGSVVVTTEVSDIVINEGFGAKVIDFSNVFTDGNNDALTYAVGTNLQVVTGSITNTNLTLTEAGIGTSIVSIRAEDTHGNVAYEDFNFRVNDVPNVATPINDKIMTHGFTSTTVDASNVFADTDEADIVTLTVTSSTPAVAAATIANGIITLTEGTVGTSTITVTANDGVGGIASESFTITIEKEAATLTVSNTLAVYDGTPKAVTITSTPANLVVNVSYMQNGIAVTSPVNAGAYTFTATVNDASYSGTKTGTLTIEKAVATLTASNTSVVYDGTTKALTITSTPANVTVNTTYAQNGNGVASPVNAGVYNVTSTVTDANYSGSYTGTFNINKADQVITFATIANVMNSNGPLTLTATSTSGLPVSFAKISGPITVSGNTVTLTGEVGSASVEAAQAGNTNYNAATTVVRTFTIDQDPILSVDDARQAHVQAYPVPAKEYLHVETGTYTISKVSLTDAFGRKVYAAEPNQTSHTINTTEVKQGVYILHVVTEKGLVSRRVEVIK